MYYQNHYNITITDDEEETTHNSGNTFIIKTILLKRGGNGKTFDKLAIETNKRIIHNLCR